MGTLTLRVLAVLACCVLAACATRGPTHAYTYKLYPGSVRLPSEIAIVRLGDAASAEFDGHPASEGDWTEVHLTPGTHAIRWWITPLGDIEKAIRAGFNPGGLMVQPTLEAGHVYTLKAKMGPTKPMLYLWMVDETTGQVVAGKPKL